MFVVQASEDERMRTMSHPPADASAVQDLPEQTDRPSEQALTAAHEAATWVDGWFLRLRLGFLHQAHRERGDLGPPPMAQLLRATGGLDAVRLKLALSCIWLAMHQPRPEIAPEPRFWADLLDLPDPATRGTRRVREGLTYLRTLGLIETKRRGPAPSLIRLRREDGCGSSYHRPDGASPEDYYLGVPAELWTKGWLAALSGPALASLLIAMSAQPFRDPTAPVWLTGERLAAYDVSADTWQAGLRELEQFGLAHRDIRRRHDPTGAADRPRYEMFVSHSTVSLNREVLTDHQVTREEWRQIHAAPQATSRA